MLNGMSTGRNDWKSQNRKFDRKSGDTTVRMTADEIIKKFAQQLKNFSVQTQTAYKEQVNRLTYNSKKKVSCTM